LDNDDVPLVGVSELRIGDGPFDMRGKDGRTGTGAPHAPQKELAPPAAKKTGLGRQFGRLGGAVSGRSRRNA